MGIFDRFKRPEEEAVLESDMQLMPEEGDADGEWMMRRINGVPPIGKKEVAKATEILTRYKQGKANLESRIVEDELWWELRHWEAIRKKQNKGIDIKAEPASGWLFNAILNKHADAMDNYPEPVVLPRERDDEESAKVLGQILPVIMEYNDFEQTYCCMNQEQKLWFTENLQRLYPCGHAWMQ